MARCRVEPDRWPLIADVSSHLTALNPDVPDFQPGKIWKTESQNIEATNDEATWNQVSTKRKKPTKKKVRLMKKVF